MRRDGFEGNRCGDADSVFGDSGVRAVVTVGIYLVVNAIRPVIVRHLVVFAVHIAVDIVFAPDVPHDVPLVGTVGVVLGIVAGADVDRGNAHAFSARWRAGARLVVVVHDVHLHTLTAIAAVARPVVDDVVAHVHAFVGLCAGTRAEAWRTGYVVGYQVVMV